MERAAPQQGPDRGGSGGAPFALEVTQEAVAAALEAFARGRSEAQVDEVEVRFGPGNARLSLRVRVRGRVWPPRPPIDTRASVAIAEVEVVDDGAALRFRVTEPLAFTSALADLAFGFLAGRWKDLPVPLASLRRAGEVVRLDLDALRRGLRGDLARWAQRVRLHALTLAPGRARLEFALGA
jgi:hypothetical protein